MSSVAKPYVQRSINTFREHWNLNISFTVKHSSHAPQEPLITMVTSFHPVWDLPDQYITSQPLISCLHGYKHLPAIIPALACWTAPATHLLSPWLQTSTSHNTSPGLLVVYILPHQSDMTSQPLETKPVSQLRYVQHKYSGHCCISVLVDKILKLI